MAYFTQKKEASPSETTLHIIRQVAYNYQVLKKGNKYVVIGLN